MRRIDGAAAALAVLAGLGLAVSLLFALVAPMMLDAPGAGGWPTWLLLLGLLSGPPGMLAALIAALANLRRRPGSWRIASAAFCLPIAVALIGGTASMLLCGGRFAYGGRVVSRPYAEVIGDPIAQSKSPVIHGFWLDRLGLDAEYRKTLVTAQDLPAFFAVRRADPDWRGCNVTMPHKLAALDHVDDRGGVRGGIGAVNTVFRDGDGTPVGTNTDAGGFYAPLAGFDLTDRPVTVIGAGGAARAILFALSRLRVGPVTILNRSTLKAGALLSSFGLKGRALPLSAPVPPGTALLVNASTLGMTGQPPLDVDMGELGDDAIVYDIVYSPLETPLLAAARARGLETVDGLEMLIGQAALAFELFFAAAPPRDGDDALRDLLLA